MKICHRRQGRVRWIEVYCQLSPKHMKTDGGLYGVRWQFFLVSKKIMT